jgi:hypothetical protein
MQDSETTDSGPPLPDEVVAEDRRSATESLWAALAADSAATKDYHVRSALQSMVVEEAPPD